MSYALVDKEGKIAQVTLNENTFAPIFTNVIDANKFIAKYKLFHYAVKESRVLT